MSDIGLITKLRIRMVNAVCMYMNGVGLGTRLACTVSFIGR